MAAARAKSLPKLIRALNPENGITYVSFAVIVQTQSIAFQSGWGHRKISLIEEFFSAVRIIEISDLLIPAYIGIDAYSQRKHPDYETYPFDTPRNMGKNDLYIAATASLLALKLVTTDGDFDHLHDSFIRLKRIYCVI